MSFSSTNRAQSAGARAAKPTGTGRRLPGSRERRPALAALAVILILLGAAGSALIALRSGDRQYFVAVKTDLPPGHRIDPDKDLTRGDLAGDTRKLVLWSEVGTLKGEYTTSRMYAGQFVTKAAFEDNPIPEGGALVGISLESGRAPAGDIEQGDIVRVIRVPATNQDGGPPAVIASAAVVRSSQGRLTDERTNANTTQNVTILVPADRATAIAAAAAAKTIVLVKLSASTKPEISNESGPR